MQYVILGAGLGSRFQKEGVSVPKPLVSLLGRPMIERLISVLTDCDADRIVIVANSRMTDLVSFLEKLKEEKGLPLDIRPVVSDNSYYSLTCGTDGLSGRFIAMTVDAIFPTDEFRSFVESVEKMPSGEVLMALTRFVDDESPLYARLNGQNEVIDYRYGGEPFDEGTIVSAGVYGLTSEAMECVASRKDYPKSLSDFQRILAAETDIKVRVYEFSKALDVDCSHDKAVAEEFLRTVNGEQDI